MGWGIAPIKFGKFKVEIDVFCLADILSSFGNVVW